MHIPYILENDNKVFDIYSKLLTNRIIFIEGEINDKLSNLIVSELLYLDSLSTEDIYLYINSPGGSITSGMAIYDTMKYIKSDVITIGIGLCASMASFLLSSGNKRYALPNTEIMIHEPIGGTEGKATDIKIASDRIIKTRERLNKILSKNTKKSLAKIKKDTSRDYYMTSTEAQKYGIIDKVIITQE